ncbi:hypothetical protein NQ318_015138 [Aromia moschata]|uniref:Uncharacterized protein n=1 Tax=Aromia moschata TaxID=1265417 RepID=A0AAV8YXN3_9CUCU|nr:hypothetical protein NQ318_015138 [Aromia moschata]
MSEENILENVSFSFKEICKVAKDIKPDCWCIVASDQRLAFIEINLPHNGPATLRKQLILNNYMQIEVYVGATKVREETLNTNEVTSVVELEECLRVFASFATCLGNRNFHRTVKMGSQAQVEYWRHMDCLLLYDKTVFRREQCCDSCLMLNEVLTKKQRKQVIPHSEDEQTDRIDTKHVSKRIKKEIDIVKHEVM